MTSLLAQNGLQSHWVAQTLASVGVVVVALALRWVLRRAVNSQHKVSGDLRRRWLLQVRNLTFALIAIGLVLIWATELKTAAISVVAIVVAIVLATKELILCLTGGFLKLSSRMFVLGDHVEINGIRGEVIDQTLLTTKLMENAAGPNGSQYTGRTITLPNAILLAQPVYNETLTKSFGLHVFTVPVKAEAGWEAHETALLKALNEACEPYLEHAKSAVAALAREEGLNTPSVEPRVQIAVPEPGRVDLIARLPYPVEAKNRVIQQVLRSYLRASAQIGKPTEESSRDAED
ncbi:MAG: mechanosensitive ion channel domain-containing protein [Phycisphaeraceae bacterium]